MNGGKGEHDAAAQEGKIKKEKEGLDSIPVQVTVPGFDGAVEVSVVLLEKVVEHLLVNVSAQSEKRGNVVGARM